MPARATAQQPTSTELPVPPATRHSVAGWRDPRLVAGVLIVALSILLGTLVVSRPDRTTAVWGARHDLPAGSVLTTADLEQRRVRLADGDLDRYLTATVGEVVGRRLVRAVGEGELVPSAALAQQGAPAGVRVPLEVGVGDLPGSVEVGSVVDVWVTTKQEQDRAVAARVLHDVSVMAVPGGQDALAPVTTRSVVVLVPGSSDENVLGPVLGEIAAGRVILTQSQTGGSR